MPQKRATLWELFFTFAKIGAVTFGGGYAMLPIIEREIVEKKQWLTYPQLMEFFAISQMTPGVIAVNTASLIGYRECKISGAVFATLGVAAPSIIVITIIASFLKIWMSAVVIGNIFAALRVCVGVLIINALVPFFKQGIVNMFTLLIFILSVLLFLVFSLSPVVIVILSALLAIAADILAGKLK